MWFNAITAFFSAGFLTGTYFIIDNSINDCANIRLTLYTVIFLHTVNIIIALINLINKEEQLCFSGMICGLFLFEMSILIFMQFVYFDSQGNRCISTAPDLYFWLMGQILVFYMGAAVVICHFFRKFCQDDEDDDEYKNNSGVQVDKETLA